MNKDQEKFETGGTDIKPNNQIIYHILRTIIMRKNAYFCNFISVNSAVEAL